MPWRTTWEISLSIEFAAGTLSRSQTVSHTYQDQTAPSTVRTSILRAEAGVAMADLQAVSGSKNGKTGLIL